MDPILDLLRLLALAFLLLLLPLVVLFLSAEWALRHRPVPPLANPLILAGALPYRVLILLDLLDLLWVLGAALSWWFLTRHRLVAIRGIVVLIDVIPGTGVLPLYTLTGWLARRLGLGHQYR